jgi:hypothetical protein
MSVLGALSTPGMRMPVCMLTSTGAVIGVLNVAIPALAGDRASTGGVLLAIMSASSMLGGLYYRTRAWKTRPSRRYVWLAAIIAAVVAPLPAAGSGSPSGSFTATGSNRCAPRPVDRRLAGR